MLARVTQYTIMKDNGAIFDEGNYRITIDDEGGGEYITLLEERDDNKGIVGIDPTHWPLIRQTINLMVAGIEKKEKREG